MADSDTMHAGVPFLSRDAFNLMVLVFLYFFREVMIKLRMILSYMLGKQLDGLLS